LINRWNEWLLFPLRLSDLPRDTLLSFTIWDTCGPANTSVIGGTAISLFGKHGSMRRGMYDLRVWLNAESNCDNNSFNNGKYSISDQINKINKVFN
jgi:phosphatidylinositol 3-kinase